MDLKEKVVVITGASSGIGEACARIFAKEGCFLSLAARRTELLQKLAQEIGPASTPPMVHKTDVTQKEEVKGLFQKTFEKFGKIDLLINNAGVGCVGKIEKVNIDHARQVMEVNYFGALYCIQEALGYMRKNNSGHIINVGSVVGKRSIPEIGTYCATKFALNAASDALRLELRGSGIDITTVCPGLTDTEFHDQQIRHKSIKHYRARIKGQTSEHVARVILKAAKKKPREVHLSIGGKFLTQIERVSPKLLDKILTYKDSMIDKTPSKLQ